MLSRIVMLAIGLCLPMSVMAADQVITNDVLGDRTGVPAVAFLSKELDIGAECHLQGSDIETPHGPRSRSQTC